MQFYLFTSSVDAVYQFTSVVDAVGRVHHASLNRMWRGSDAARVECCRQCAACGGESAADGVQLVGETAEAAMSGLSILILIMVMRQIHRITVRV